jgi:chromosome segregation ATPase
MIRSQTTHPESPDDDDDDDEPDATEPLNAPAGARTVNGTHDDDESSEDDDEDDDDDAAGGATERLDALAKERDSLRAEVTQLRKSLEEVNGKHAEEVSALNEQVKESVSGKEQAETQYKTLLGRVNTIRSQLGDRLKQDAVCLG